MCTDTDWLIPRYSKHPHNKHQKCTHLKILKTSLDQPKLQKVEKFVIAETIFTVQRTRPKFPKSRLDSTGFKCDPNTMSVADSNHA